MIDGGGTIGRSSGARGVAGALGLVLALGAGACTGEGDAGSAEAAAPQSEGTARVINVEVSPVETTTFTDRIRLTGTVKANQDVTVAAEESGRIREILAEKGTHVSAGQSLLKIDDAILQAEVQQARARAMLAEEIWQRRKRLYEEENVGTGQAYLEARATAEETAASLDVLEERLARTVVRAPFAGVLEDRLVELGQMVSPGTSVARVVEMDHLKVTAGVPERFAVDVRPGTEVSAAFEVLPNERFDGEISYVGSTVNPQSRTFPVEFVIDNPEEVVKPEMVANIAMVRRELEDAVVVPQEALVRTADGFRAFVVEGTGERPVVRARDVVVGATQQNRVVIESGLEAGDRLVVVGQQTVAEGDRVRVVQGNGAGVAEGTGGGE